jgi:hypothetical protein
MGKLLCCGNQAKQLSITLSLKSTLEYTAQRIAQSSWLLAYLP